MLIKVLVIYLTGVVGFAIFANYLSPMIMQIREASPSLTKRMNLKMFFMMGLFWPLVISLIVIGFFTKGSGDGGLATMEKLDLMMQEIDREDENESL